jgi:hypothetical protein
LQDKYDASLINGILYDQRIVLLANLAWLIPFVSLYAYYSLRWFLLGRIKPFWLWRSKNIEAEEMHKAANI